MTFNNERIKGEVMQFVSGMIYGAGFTFAGVLVLTAMKALFGMGIC